MTEEIRPEHQNSAEGQAGVPLKDLGLSTRVLNALKEGGLETVQDLMDILSQGEDEFFAIKGVREKSLEEVQARLSAGGFLAGEISEGADEKLSPADVETGRLPRTESEIASDDPSAEKEIEMTEKRISFVVRLTVDERGRPLRTEIEHAETREKEPSAGLDLEKLGSFMKKIIKKTTTEKESRRPAKDLPEGVSPEGPEQKIERALWLSISDVQVYPRGAQNLVPLAFDPEQAMVVQVHFELNGTEASTLTAQEPPYETTVYVLDVTRISTPAVKSSRGNLAQDKMANRSQIEVTELTPGLYRLMTFISVLSPDPLRAHYEGPVIQVSEFQPTVEPSASAGVPNRP